MTFGISEVADCKTCAFIHFGTHFAPPAEALGPLKRGLYIGDTDVEDRMALVVLAAPNPARDSGPVVGRIAVDEAVVTWLGDRRRNGRAGIELPTRTDRRRSPAASLDPCR